jgi:hypothetical protein
MTKALPGSIRVIAAYRLVLRKFERLHIPPEAGL